MTQQISLFASALGDLFDKTDFYTRKEWSRFLGVEESVLDDWVKDRAVPEGGRLWMLFDLMRVKNIPKAPFEQFEAIAQRPAIEVSPFGAFLAPTVAAYIERSTFVALGASLRFLSREQQSRVLRGSWDKDAIDTYLQAQ